MESAPTAGRITSPERAPVRLSRLGDERLAELVASGRDRAFAAVYERYHQPLYRYCRSLLRDDADSQDVLQSTFASALVALREGRRNAPMRPWLFRIAHNEAISLLRRRRGVTAELSDSVLPPVASAADQADARARVAQLVADLAQLPERQRAALLMRELNGLSHVEIAVALGTSVSAAKQAIFDARTALLELAEGRAMGCEEVRRKISERDRRLLRGRRLRSHLRGCSSCAAFAVAIHERHSDLQALAPLLPAAAAGALMTRVAGTAPGQIAGGGVGGGGAAATAGAVGKLGGAALVSKTSAALLVTAALGVGGLTKGLPLGAGSGSAGQPHTKQTPRVAARSGGRSATAVGATGVGAHYGAVAAHRSRASTGARTPTISAAGSPGRGTAISALGGHGTESPAAGHSRSGSGAGVAPGVSHGRSGVSHGQSGVSHGQSGVSHGQSGVSHGQSGVSHGRSGVSHDQSDAPHGGHQPRGAANSSQRPGRNASSGGDHAGSGGHRAGGLGSAVKQPARASPPVHSAPSSSSTTTAATTTTDVSSTAAPPGHGRSTP